MQLKLKLNNIIICYLFIKLKKKHPKYTILHIIKLLYDIAKAKNHQFIIYLNYYKKKLSIKIFSYNIYLFITKNKNESFSITRFQIDNTFNMKIEIFINKEEVKIIKAKIKAKS